MAIACQTLILTLVCLMTLMHPINCKPVKRSATDCYGTDCVIPQDQLDFHGNPRDTELLENITGTVNHAFPEVTHLLESIAHQNATINHLPLIVQTLEYDKNLQASQNGLIENGTAMMVKALQDQADRQSTLLENATASLHQVTYLMQDQADGQSKLMENVTSSLQRVIVILEDQAKRQDQLLETVASFLPHLTDIWQIQQDERRPRYCVSGLTSGKHTIWPKNNELGALSVVCDMDTDGGKWIVLQRRFDGSVDFDRVWVDYESGFGTLDGEFWLGLKKMNVITSHDSWELRVDIEDFNGNQAYAVYDHFNIGNSASHYRLDIGSYSGTAGDSMRIHDLNGMAFTTKDQDHDRRTRSNCAIEYSAWWMNSCTHAHLNGRYVREQTGGFHDIYWYKWENNWKLLKKTELKIRLI